MKIESQDTDIESMLNSSYFHIPRFQRPYSWDEENINDFWDDVITNNSQDYFIGSMVVFQTDKQNFGVVDGQQRLTTITILLCVIRDALLSIDSNDLAEGIHQLIERKDRSNKYKYVLRTETSFPYFQEYIQKFKEEADVEIKSVEEEIMLESAHRQFKTLVNNVMASISKDPSKPERRKNTELVRKLTELRDYVFNLNVIFITLDKEEDAYVIFETLNTRGKDLALSDLVKNHFTKHLPVKGDVDQTNLKWTKVLETIHNSSADISTNIFIYHYWASRYEAIPQKKLFARFKRAVTKPKAKKYLDELVIDSGYYRSLHEAGFDWKKNEVDVARSLAVLQLFKLSQPTPAVLSLVRAYREKKIKLAKLRDTLKTIEKFHFQFTAVTSSRSSGGISAMYSSFAQKLHKSNNSNDASLVINSLAMKLRERVPSNSEFTAAFCEISYTNSNSKQKALVQYILREFSLHYKYSYPGVFDELTIEHLHPQSKSSGSWSEQEIGSLGNLLLVDTNLNTKLDSKRFLEKLEILAGTKQLPAFIAGRKSWTSKTVASHTLHMAEVAYNNIWSI